MFKLSKELILTSKSPRRQKLLREAGFTFKPGEIHIEETYPEYLEVQEVAKYLAEKKAQAYQGLKPNQLVLAADTVVISNDPDDHQKQIILGKPQHHEEAFQMLKGLSNNQHTVITGVCLRSADQMVSFDDNTVVYFREISDAEINYYIQHFQPFDKAGAYGIQEWLGMIGIEKIHGSYFNVVGLPIHKLYEALKSF